MTIKIITIDLLLATVKEPFNMVWFPLRSYYKKNKLFTPPKAIDASTAHYRSIEDFIKISERHKFNDFKLNAVFNVEHVDLLPERKLLVTRKLEYQVTDANGIGPVIRILEFEKKLIRSSNQGIKFKP